MNKYSVVTYYKMLPFDHYLKSIINIGYINSVKGPSFVWYRLSKKRVNKNNIKIRHTFKPDYRIDKAFRVTYKDYKKSGMDKGHLASDASFDYNKDSLDSVYVYSNAVPQKHRLNAYVWGALEKYSRYVTMKLGYTYIVNIALYTDNTTIGNNVGVPTVMFKVILNNKNKFLKIFRVEQTDTVRSLKRYNITFEELMTELKSKNN